MTASRASKHNLNVARTAASVSYTAVFVFSSAFKKHFGVSPGEYVKKYNTYNVHWSDGK